MDNIVVNCVDNFEDNCVENDREINLQIPEWVKTWTDFTLKQLNLSTEIDESSRELIQNILIATTQGNSCLNLEAYSSELVQQIAIDAQTAESQVAPFVFDQNFIYLYRYWQLEYRFVAQIQRLQGQAIEAIDVNNYEHLLEDEHQKNALKRVAKHAFNIITGGPGTGKTYTLARIIAVLSQSISDIRVAMAAPTGKAAQRMKEALQASLNDEKLNQMGLVSEQLKNQDTLTIHRLLGLGNQYKAKFNLRQPLPYDVIVIDEASMLDLNLATLLLEAVPDHCRLILLGDANQLASVDVGSVLADLQQADALEAHRTHLVTSRRFKEGALIGEMAQFIQQQSTANLDSSDVLQRFEKQVIAANELQPIALYQGMPDQIQLQYLPKHIPAHELANYYEKLSWGYSNYFNALKEYLESEDSETHIASVIKAFDDYRILTAIRHGDFGLYRLNVEMKNALLSQLSMIIPQGDWYVGRAVMMTYNDYQLGISNGDIGVCFKHRTQPNQFEVYFSSLDKWVAATRLPKSIETAFALTIHKSQGSEFTHTAVVLDHAAKQLLSQELIYTAITRAKSVVTLLVDMESLAQSFQVKTTRSSGLVNKMNKISLTNGR